MNIVILIEAIDQLNFFIKFKKWLETSSINPSIITDKLSIYIKLKINTRFNIHLVEKHGNIHTVPDLDKSYEILTTQFSKTEAKLHYSAVYFCAESIILNNKNLIIFIWGGNTIASIALKNVAQHNSIPTLFFDFGNYDNKIFVDPIGTNIDSFFYNNFELVYKYVDVKSIKHNSINLSLTKEQTSKKNLNLFFFLDILYCWKSGLPFRGEKNPLKKLYDLLDSVFLKQKMIILKKNSFYLIAFCHSFELKRLGIAISDVVKKVTTIIEDANAKNFKVYAKFHPNESDKFFRSEMEKLINKNCFMIVNTQNVDLIEQASKVYLFNTSLAIPCILKEKDISFLSESFFDKFNKQSLIYFLNFYLIELKNDPQGYFMETSINRIFKKLEHLRVDN